MSARRAPLLLFGVALALLVMLTLVIRPDAGRGSGAGGAGPTAHASDLRPEIRKWRIPYGNKRKKNMAGYSKRHYGKREWRLLHVKQIVEHIAVTSNVKQIYNTFAPNRPDVEYHELPGVCSHFAVSSKGTLFKFVPATIRCRHTVGLNHVSIGIEHVGYADEDVLNNQRMFKRSLRLTRYLRCRFGVKVKNVIGHNESLSSPFYKELDPDFQGRTHGDWTRGHMSVYRHKLFKLGGC